jgi:anti-sigma regulatory factor (Ser/Thr protein kinase)/anti-anti-sigma regulatory factor
MKISTHNSEFDDSVILLNLQGNLQSEDCSTIHRTVRDIINSGGFFVMAVMEKVTSLSSPVVGKLMECRYELRQKSGDLVLVGLKNRLKKKLIGFGVDKVFQMFNDAHMAYHRYQWDYVNSEQSLKLSFPPRLKDVPVVRMFLSQIARQKGYNDKDAFRIETIVDEVINNAIEHGHPNQTEITLEYGLDKKKIEFLVKNKTNLHQTDNLKSLIHTNKPVKPMDRESGRGLSLVKMISNAINVSLDETGTFVKVTKFREDVSS